MTREIPEGPSVLLVDDDEKVRKSLRGALEDYGIDVVGEATDGVEGVAMAWKLMPDVIVMDFRMPDMNGIQAVEQIRQSSDAIQIIFLSAHEDKVLQTDAKIAGACRYLVKGSRVSDIVAAIGEAWRAAQGVGSG